MNEKQVEIYRNMTPQKKFQIMENMFWTARNMKEAFFRENFPYLSDVEIKQKVKEAILYARDW